ncbi:MAG: EF-hand domain-containing protein [Desulfobulbaceae bacterium]|nr:EF-hand domain-containing protein [Desulfobulbaceae bacterium]
MISGISGSGGSMAQMQMQGLRQRPNQGERFNKLDADKNGGIDQAELQTLSDQFSTITGQQLNVEEVSKAYDSNSDGLLAQDEMQSMMMDLQEKMGGPQGGRNSMQALAAYQSDPNQDQTSILLDMLSGEEEDQEEYIPLDTQA